MNAGTDILFTQARGVGSFVSLIRVNKSAIPALTHRNLFHSARSRRDWQ